jgi:hypothetical protein
MILLDVLKHLHTHINSVRLCLYVLLGGGASLLQTINNINFFPKRRQKRRVVGRDTLCWQQIFFIKKNKIIFYRHFIDMASEKTSYEFEVSEATVPGTIASLHLHPAVSGGAMTDVKSMTLVPGKGIFGNVRYYDIRNRQGKANKNHVSLFEREQIAQHATDVGLKEIAPGVVLSNVETKDIDLLNLVGFDVQIGATAILRFYKGRVPCARMDAIALGLAKAMRHRQGVIAEVIVGGDIKIGDKIFIVEEKNTT